MKTTIALLVAVTAIACLAQKYSYVTNQSLPDGCYATNDLGDIASIVTTKSGERLLIESPTNQAYAKYPGWRLIAAVTNIAIADGVLVQSSDGLRRFYGADPCLITNVVNSLAVSGDICRVRGHAWRDGCEQGPGCLVLHGGPMRTCTVCGKTETQSAEWK